MNFFKILAIPLRTYNKVSMRDLIDRMLEVFNVRFILRVAKHYNDKDCTLVFELNLISNDRDNDSDEIMKIMMIKMMRWC